MKTALVLLTDGVEEMEFTAPVDLLRRAGVTVVVAAVDLEEDNLIATGRNGIRLGADVDFTAVQGKVFDLVVLPGGPGHVTLRQNRFVLHMLRNQAMAQRWIGAICAAPLILHEATLLKGKNYTGHPTIEAELPARDAVRPVVQDGKIITSQGAGTATRFSLALVSAICGPEAADEVATSICA